MAREIKVPDADHPISIDVGTVRVVARVGDIAVADTSAALTMREAGYPPVHYIPLGDLVPGMLRPGASDSYCPYKGDASYYDVVLPDGKEITDAAWTYRAPYPAVDAIAGCVAFYTDRVQVEVETRLPPASLAGRAQRYRKPDRTVTAPELGRPSRRPGPVRSPGSPGTGIHNVQSCGGYPASPARSMVEVFSGNRYDNRDLRRRSFPAIRQNPVVRSVGRNHIRRKKSPKLKDER